MEYTTSEQFAHFIALEQEDPSDPIRGDLQAAMICRSLMFMLTPKKDRGKIPSLWDLRLKFETTAKEHLDDTQVGAKNKAYLRTVLGC